MQGPGEGLPHERAGVEAGEHLLYEIHGLCDLVGAERNLTPRPPVALPRSRYFRSTTPRLWVMAVTLLKGVDHSLLTVTPDRPE